MLGRDRNRIFVKGLGVCAVREVWPTPAAEFVPLGYLDMSRLNDAKTREIIKGENGATLNALTQEESVEFITNLLQTSIDEIDFKRNAPEKIYAVQYYGPASADVFQYYCVESKIDGNVPLEFTRGKRFLPMSAIALDISDEKGYTIPLYYLYQGAKVIAVDKLGLWIDARLGHNVATSRVLDISGFSRHGLLNSDYASIWQTGTPARFLRFDGVNDQLDFGDILDDDGVGDFVIEIWFKTPAADASLQEVLSKKSLVSDNSAGFAISRKADNTIAFRLGSGSASVEVANATTTLQNVLRHFAVAVDRNGNATPYLNGVADGAPASVAAIGSGTNALSLYVGRDGTNFGQIDFDSIRIHQYGAGGLPSDIATIIQRHYNAEKAFHAL